MFTHCPKCNHTPLPQDQALPAACPVCGVIFAKLTSAVQNKVVENKGFYARVMPSSKGDKPSLANVLFETPFPLEPMAFWARTVMLLAFVVWSFMLIRMDYRTGEMGGSFIHRPLLIFHEAGHVIFLPFGQWVMVLGGTLGQLIMPVILGAALLVKNRDPFGASIGLWFFGVSLLDIAPYMYDALHPQLILLSGMTGEEGGHDWIYLFSSLGLLRASQWFGGVIHTLGAFTTILAMVWGGWALRLQQAQRVLGAYERKQR